MSAVIKGRVIGVMLLAWAVTAGAGCATQRYDPQTDPQGIVNRGEHWEMGPGSPGDDGTGVGY